LRKRSPQLQEIDSAVGAYHKSLQTAANDYAKRDALSTALLTKIQDWEKTKSATGQVKSTRASVVNDLRRETQREQQMIAAHKLRADQQAAAYRPEKVAVYSAGMLLDNKGNFTGDTALDYATVKGTSAEGTTEAAIRLALLKSKLDQAYTEFKHDPTHDAQVLGVFTAPEWLFKKPDVSFTQQDKLYIEERCKECSAACPDMLVVLGSTIWTKGDGEVLELRGTAFALFNGDLVHETPKRAILFDEDGYDKNQMTKAWDKAKQTDKDSSLFMVGNRFIALEFVATTGEPTRSNRLPTA
jgi:hypothetical protein